MAGRKCLQWRHETDEVVYPLLTLAAFRVHGLYAVRAAWPEDLLRMFHWCGWPVHGGLGIGTIFLMVAVTAMNGLKRGGHGDGAKVFAPAELLRRGL